MPYTFIPHGLIRTPSAQAPPTRHGRRRAAAKARREAAKTGVLQALAQERRNGYGRRPDTILSGD